MGRIVKTNLPCPVCGSSDGGAIYKNKDKQSGDDLYIFKCFSGHHPTHPKAYKLPQEFLEDYEDEVMRRHNKALGKDYDKNIYKELEDMTTEHVKDKVPMGLIDTGSFEDLDSKEHPWGIRSIKENTCRFYGVKIAKNVRVSRNQKTLETLAAQGESPLGEGLIFPYFSSVKNELIAQKVRTKIDKKGSWYKANENAVTLSGFFGQQLFQSTSHDDIAITFGELDAMSVYQMIGIPTVSVKDGDTSAPKLFRQEYGWLSRFRTIYVIPDNDDSCRAVLPAIGAIFPKKIKIVHLSKHKDPNDYLVNGDAQLFRREFNTAAPFSPEQIISLKELSHLLYEDPPKPVADYPWEGLNKMTGGIWAGELITVKAPPKIGKTSIMSAIAFHLKETTNKPIGLIYLEETQRDLIFRFVSMKLRKNLQRQEVLASTTREEIEEAQRELFETDNVFVVDKSGSCPSDFIEEKITELVRAKGCEFIFFDHISMAITDESNKDERIALDRLVSAIKALTVGIPDIETVESIENGERTYKTVQVVRQPTIFMVTHVNDAGQTRGSRAAVQLSNLVIALKRDKLAKDRAAKNTTEIVIEESRRYGESGLACKLYYDALTSSFVEIPIVEEGEEEGGNDTPVFDNTKQGNSFVYQALSNFK